MPLPPPIQHLVDAIHADTVNGSAVIAANAARALSSALDQPYLPEAPTDLVAFIAEVARALIAAQPAMASLVTLANRTLEAADGQTDATAVKGAARTACGAFIIHTERSGTLIGREAASLITDGAAVMTNSFSSTVLRALLVAHEAGRQFRVICSEGRPGNEGIALARRLDEAGIPVRLVIDAAAHTYLTESTLVMVGADSVSAAGVVNKIGSSWLALGAHTMGVPFYSLCGTDKFLPAGYAHEQERRDPAEILDGSPCGIDVVNLYFDVLPAPLTQVAGVVTEEGVLSGVTLASRLAALRLHPALSAEEEA